jgi:hypothetical protein
MTITVDDIELRQALHMTDNSDGGGRMSGVKIVSGVENQIFDDISDVDRAVGDVSIRKFYGAVASANTDKFLDAGLVVFKAPADADVTVLAFTTGSFYDERPAMADAVQRYLERSTISPFRLKGTHNPGQRVIFGYLLLSALQVGQTPYDLFYDKVLSLAYEISSVTQYEQFVRVVHVTHTATNSAVAVNYTDGDGTFAVVEVILDISSPLDYSFPGAADNHLSTYTPPTVTRYTQVGTPTQMVSITPLAANVSAGATTLTVESIKTAVVPVEYQDLGETTFSQIGTGLTYPSGLYVPDMTQVLNAPAGYTLNVTPTVEPYTYLTPVKVWYQYGGEWIGPDDSGAATYTVYATLDDRISFPRIPDSGSKVFIQYPPTNAMTFQASGLSATPVSSYSMTLTGTIYPGSVVAGDEGLNGNWLMQDQGDGTLSGALGTGTINYSTGALVVTMNTSLPGNSLGAHKSTTAAIWQRTAFAALVSAPMIESYTRVSGNAADDGATLISTTDSGGALSGNSITGTADYTTGLIQVTFPEAVRVGTFAVAYRLGGVIAQSAAILGLDSTRLPKDGQVQTLRQGDFVLIHHTDEVASSNLVANQDINCGRTGLYRAEIVDSTLKQLGSDQYTVNRATGHVVMAATIDLTGFTGPYAIRHTLADMARMNAIDPSGAITLNKPLINAYSTPDSYVSGVLFAGTLQARVTNLFAQLSWTSVWSDTQIGGEILAQYNTVAWPIEVSNLGAYPDRYLIKRTSATDFQVIGENLGIIGVGDANNDCSPINPITLAPYFTIRYQGWGSGWALGNCLRFNIIAAAFPVGTVRAIQPSAPSGIDPDGVEYLLIGNVDA